MIIGSAESGFMLRATVLLWNSLEIKTAALSRVRVVGWCLCWKKWYHSAGIKLPVLLRERYCEELKVVENIYVRTTTIQCN